MFQALNRDEGITIVIVTHDPTVAAHAGRVIHMRDGVIEADTTAAESAMPQRPRSIGSSPMTPPRRRSGPRCARCGAT